MVNLLNEGADRHNSSQSTGALPDLSRCLTEQRYVASIVSLLCSVLFVSTMFIVIANTTEFQVDTIGIQIILAVPELQFLNPEPLERLLYFCGVLIMPGSLLVFYTAGHRLCAKIKNERVFNRIYQTLSSLMLVLAAFLVWIDCKEDGYYFFQHSVGSELISLLLVVATAFSGWYYLVRSGRISRVISGTLELISIISIVLITLFCMYGLSSITYSPIYFEHLNAVFHAVVQVYLGKELLADLSHQYGLYPHFLEPVFRVSGLSVLRFTTVMGLLMGLSLSGIYKFLKEITSNRTIACLGFCSLVYYGYVFFRVNAYFDQYFQYHPIRFLFPAVSIYLTYRYLKSEDKKIYYLSFLIYSMAIFWNFDTGFVVFVSWLLLLLFLEMRGMNVRNMLGHIATGAIIFVLFAALFTSYMSLRYGNVPDYRAYIEYVKIFYSYGYAMLPMKIISPWNLVILIYMIGLLYSITAVSVREKYESIKVPMVFFLSILGAGLFSYFQGRSHDLNLASACYPSIIIMTLFADTLLQSLKAGNRCQEKLILFGILVFFLFSTASLLKNLPAMATDTSRRLRRALDSGVTSRGFQTDHVLKTEFVKAHTKKSEEVLILSSLSSIYYLASGTTCPVKVPGPAELFLKEEYRKIYDYLQSSQCRYIILDDDFAANPNKSQLFGILNPYKMQLAEYIRKNFRAVASMPDGRMHVFAKL